VLDGVNELSKHLNELGSFDAPTSNNCIISNDFMEMTCATRIKVQRRCSWVKAISEGQQRGSKGKHKGGWWAANKGNRKSQTESQTSRQTDKRANKQTSV